MRRPVQYCQCLLKQLVVQFLSSNSWKMALPTGQKIVELTPRQLEIEKLFTGHYTGAFTLQPDGWYLPQAMKKYCQEIKDFEFEENDVLVMTVPKAGTTWTQEAVWTMRKNPNLDNPASSLPLHVRSPVLEADILAEGLSLDQKGGFAELTKEQGKDPNKGVFINIARAAERPRIFKTHLSFTFISDTALSKAKVVYTIRDPRDLCLSYHHHSRLFKYEGFTGTLDQYVDAFLEDSVTYGPYWAHVKAAWDRRHLPNMLVLFYEKMKKNPKAEFTKLSKFLGVDLNEEQIDKIVHHISFTVVQCLGGRTRIWERTINKVLIITLGNNFVVSLRPRSSGGWKEVLSEKQQERFKVWMEKNCPDKEILDNFNNP
ncbi:sulfotransferase 1C4 [Hyalella azteca]|uniref:Sulfotransferase 1C4 n=1 Tax=Hyalella azteca TaxID=294128 RepID=A0A8B7N5T9_HYAAZ|nr:sulfotransferase 1C4 [Hyalella azteca]